MDIIKEIIRKKRGRLTHTKGRIPIVELKSRLSDLQNTKDFRGCVSRKDSNIRLIAEIKRASPSKGIIREPFDLAAIAETYQKKPVSAISILTEEDFFKGELSSIPRVRDITNKPLLRKDFIFDEYQLYESRVNQADAILLIAAILEKSQAEEYLHLASELALDVLFEVHDEADLQNGLDINAEIIGINNRNLKTMEIDLSTTFRLKSFIPGSKIVVAESGIRNKDDVKALNDAGVDAMLIGTSIMQAKDIEGKIDELTQILI